MLLFASAWADDDSCTDSNNGALSYYDYFGCSDSDGASCGAIADYNAYWYGSGYYCGSYSDDDFTANDMCCDCGGGGFA